MSLILRNVKGSALSYTELDGNFLYLSQSIINLGETNSPVLQQSITSNRVVGGVAEGTTFTAGTTLESIIRAMLNARSNSTLSNVSLVIGINNVFPANTTSKYVEVNSTFTFGVLNFTTTANSEGQLPINVTFETEGNPDGDFTYIIPNTSIGLSNNIGITNRNITANDQTNVAFSFYGQDFTSGNSLTTSTKTLLFVYPYFYGVSRTNIDFWTAGNYISSSAGITGSISAASSKTVSFYTDQNNVQNLWFSYPSNYGDLSDIRDSNNQDLLTGGFFTLQEVTENTSGGNLVSYNVYKSTATIAPPGGYSVTFSL
jgi:hypothetical protein